jgi:hypothetical protein
MTTDPKVTPEAVSLEIPASFVNQFQIAVVGNNVRISFAEGFAGIPPNYRSAVMMSAQDARILATAILRSLPTPPNALAAYLREPGANSLLPTGGDES